MRSLEVTYEHHHPLLVKVVLLIVVAISTTVSSSTQPSASFEARAPGVVLPPRVQRPGQQDRARLCQRCGKMPPFVYVDPLRVEVYSRSTGEWHGGNVVEVHDDSVVVEFKIRDRVHAKNVRRHSEHIRLCGGAAVRQELFDLQAQKIERAEGIRRRIQEYNARTMKENRCHPQ